MTQSHDIHRHRDGSIDFDSYRAQAAMLRGQAMRDAFKLKATFNFTLIALAVIIGVTIAASAPTHWV